MADESLYGWEAKRRRKLVLGLDATPEQRLDWLEEMVALAHASGALPRRRDYVIQLDGTIELGAGQGRAEHAELIKASFVSTSAGELSFVGSWDQDQERWSMRLKGLTGERFVGAMSAPRHAGDYRMHMSTTRVRIAPREWVLRGTYMDDGGEPGDVAMRLAEKSYL